MLQRTTEYLLDPSRARTGRRHNHVGRDNITISEIVRILKRRIWPSSSPARRFLLCSLLIVVFVVARSIPARRRS